MEISREMINYLKFPREILELALAPYQEMPTGEHPFVMQHHWRGRSVHVDWRMKVDGYLLGWTVLDNPKGTPLVETMEEAERALTSVPFIFKAKNINQGRRAETKARQPTEWIKIHGITKPGEVGATKEKIGVIYAFERGVWLSGVQKPYFHEYFIKSSTGRFFPKDQWFRIVVRRVGVPVLDPETGKPLEKREAMWRVLIPSTQEPYAISQRAMKREYKPPKENPYPFPLEWTKKNFSEQFKKWEEWKKGGTKEEKTCKYCWKFEKCTDPETLANPDRLGCENWVSIELIKSLESLPFAGYKNFADCVKKNQDKRDPSAYCASIARRVGEIKSASKFVLHFNSWMGQFVVRGVPKREWYLRIDDKGSGGVRSFFFDRDPLYYEPISGEDEGRVDRKWLDFEGKIAPRTKYNPNKKIPAIMKIVDKGAVSITSETEEGVEIINLKFNGKELKGKWRLVQEEKKAPTYNFEKLSEELAALKFVLQKHWIPKGEGKPPKFPEDFVFHWDIRFSNGTEFNLYKDPLLVETEEEIKSRRKTYSPEKIKPWMEIDEEHKFMLVGPLPTRVDPVDKGEAQIFEMSPDFVSMQFKGNKLKGYFIWKKRETDQIFMRSRLPKVEKNAILSEETGTTDDEKTIEKILRILELKALEKTKSLDLKTLEKNLERLQKETEETREEKELETKLKKKKLEFLERWIEADKNENV